MLDKKTLYLISLLHKASNLYPAHHCDGVSPCLEELRLRSYLSGCGCIRGTLNETSLVAVLNELGSFIDPLPLSKERKAEFPRTLRQFNRSYKLWLSSIYETQL